MKFTTTILLRSMVSLRFCNLGLEVRAGAPGRHEVHNHNLAALHGLLEVLMRDGRRVLRVGQVVRAKRVVLDVQRAHVLVLVVPRPVEVLRMRARRISRSSMLVVSSCMCSHGTLSLDFTGPRCLLAWIVLDDKRAHDLGGTPPG